MKMYSCHGLTPASSQAPWCHSSSCPCSPPQCDRESEKKVKVVDWGKNDLIFLLKCNTELIILIIVLVMKKRERGTRLKRNKQCRTQLVITWGQTPSPFPSRDQRFLANCPPNVTFCGMEYPFRISGQLSCLTGFLCTCSLEDHGRYHYSTNWWRRS